MAEFLETMHEQIHTIVVTKNNKIALLKENNLTKKLKYKKNISKCTITSQQLINSRQYKQQYKQKWKITAKYDN